ncbi:hypothetical protein BKA70DRAFT_1270397 [Coprinopsis sp. MPI-PUGE-AT-0042]|nr:hypothetical protein BKA70DRAFT_1270397 [Coprinopsis sp. MPI-PUGE-AT-0042]
MRWSLVLATSIALASLLVTFGYSLVIPPQASLDLIVRTGNRESIAEPSKNVRAAALCADWVFMRDPDVSDQMIRMKATDPQSIVGKQADHVLEVQLIWKHMRANGKDYQDNSVVPLAIKKEVKERINSKTNVAIISGPMNARKGSFYRSGTEDKKSGVTDPETCSYIEISFATAKEVARIVDGIYSKANINAKNPTVEKYLIETATKASLKPSQFWESLENPSASSGASNPPPAAPISPLAKTPSKPVPPPKSPDGSPGSPNKNGKRPIKASPSSGKGKGPSKKK